MEKNNYSIDKNCLIIRTECGEYRFKINGDTELANAQRIADVMVSEMEKVEKKFHTASKNSNSYTKLLLSNLNISDRFIQLEHKYNHLLKEHEEMKKLYQRRNKSDDAHTQRLEKDKVFHKAKASNNAEPFKIKKEVESNKEALPEKQHPSAQALTKSPTQRAVHEPAKPEPQAKPLEKPLPSVQTPAQTPAKTQTTIKKQTDEPVQEQAKQAIPPYPEPQAKPLEQPLPVQTPAEAPAKAQTTIKKQADEPVQEQAKQAIPPHPEPQAKPLEKPLAHEPAMPEPPVEPPIEPLEKPQVEPLSQLRINTPEKNLTNSIELGNNYSDEFQLPSLDFLKKADMEIKVDHEAIRRDAELLEQKLGYFGIKGEVMEVSPGPVITTFEYKPAPGIKISKIVNLADDLALALSALSIRILAPIPGKDVIGVEIPNAKMSIVPFIDIVGSDEFLNIDSNIPVCLGKDIIGNAVVVELEKMPHLLIAGATGTGKSVGLNAMIASILYKSSPDKVKFIMIDPKRIELSLFNDIPHLLTPVITDMKKANTALQWVVREMERRYEMLARLQVRNIDQYNHKITTADMSEYDEDETFEEFAYIVIIIDELADLMMTASKDIEFSLTRIAQMARAAGIHLILATQRPSVDVLTGIIKANFPTRISFQVSSKTDSRTIIDANGAETLLGRGDMLFVPPGTARLTRVHGTYLSEDELITITNFLKAQGKPRYVLDVTTEKEEEPAVDVSSNDDYDEKYQAALEYILATRQASISSVQRALRVGYNRAARIIDLMEKKGIIGPSDGVKPRQVLIDRME